MKKARFLALPLVLVMLSLLFLAPVSTEAAAPATSTATIPITLPGVAGGNFTGTLSNLNVVSQAGNLFLQGNLTGTVTNAAGAVVGTLTNLPLSSLTGGSGIPLTAAGTCAILHLTLGPIDLNLLGLVVHTNQIVLNIDAQSGPGNLLGNLLCTVAHLLDGNASGNAISNLLNKVLGQLTGSLGGLLGGL